MSGQRVPYFKLLCSALQFITRIPVSHHYTKDLEPKDYAKAVIAFPIVGMIIGFICVFIFAITQLWWGNFIAATFFVLMGAMITGAFHLDGLADTADGIFTSRKREKMLEIMRDSRIGTNGALALLFVVVLKIAVVFQLTELNKGIFALLITAPVLARTLAVIVLMFRQPYAREQGLGHLHIGNVTPRAARITLITGLLITLIFTGFHGLFYAFFTFVFALGYRALINSKIGGQTGDTLGAGIELFELVFLLLMLA